MSALKELNKKNLADFDDVEICIKQVELNWPIHAEIVESAARIYADLRAKTTWQPIETCPEKTDVLVLLPSASGVHIEQAERIRGQYFALYGYSREFEPTHWMPLPEPPEE